MEIHVLFSVLVLAAILFPFPSSTAQPPKIDYYQVVFQWPGSLCSKKPQLCVPNPPKRFTLHGLWPDSSATTTTPSNCTPHVAFHAPIPAQERDLKQHWPNILLSKNNHQFWEHEWELHGRCAAPLNQEQFFDLAIDLHKAIRIDSWLFNLPKPAVGLRIGAWNTFDVSAATVADLGVRPILRFNDYQGKLQLKEVVICYNGQRYVNCPSNRKNTIPPAAYYLP